MALYLSSDAVLRNYSLLGPRDDTELYTGKKNHEQTSGLGIFLACDKTQRQSNTEIIDLNHNSEVAETEQRPRASFAGNFASTYLLQASHDGEAALVTQELGYATRDGADGERFLVQKVGNNFLTTQVLRATNATEIQDYPKRPAPLLQLGVAVNNGRWGMGKHPEWRNNLSVYFRFRQTPEDYFPLIVFLLRGRDLEPYRELGFPEALESALQEMFTEELCEHLIQNSTTNSHDWDTPELLIDDIVPPDLDFGQLVRIGEPVVVGNLVSEALPLEAGVPEATIPGNVNIEPPASLANEPVEWPDIDDFDIDGIFIKREMLKSVLAVLQSGNHLILTGPPGTGKTTFARIVAERCKGNRYKLHTATSDWTTHEVIGGYMPELRRPECLNFFPGFVPRAFESNDWLIIDEINRAEVDKAFGELFTILSCKDVTLTSFSLEFDGSGALTGEPRQVVLKIQSGTNYELNKYKVYEAQPDWRLIGTMNTFDKAALYQLSYAFMRRFAFFEIPAPSAEELHHVIDRALAEELRADYTMYAQDWGRIRDYLVRVFATTDTGLHGAKRPVGASIPLDIIKYLKARIEFENNGEIRHNHMVFEAIEAFLFPQFESNRRDHRSLSQHLGRALDFTGSDQEALEKSLASWTGIGAG